MLDNMDEAIEKTKKRLDDGSRTVTELDLLRLEIGRSNFAKGVIEVDASTRLTKSALGRAIGWNDPDEFDIADRRLQPVDFALAPLTDYLNEGPERRPEWRQLISGIDAQTAKVKLEEANYYPTIFLATGVRYAVAGNRSDQKNPFVNDEFNYIEPVGVVGLHWDLSLLTNRAKVAQERAGLEKLMAQRRDAATGFRLDIERAYLDVERAQGTITAVKKGRKAARGLLILSVSNFDLGIGDAEELFEAFGSYTQTSTDFFRAVYDFNLSVAELGRTVGHDLVETR
jgi:outer membrane protein TolC